MAGEIAVGVTSPAVLLDLVHDIEKISVGFSDVFKKDCTDLVRRISLLTHLFEEIKRCSGSAANGACDDAVDDDSKSASVSSCLNTKNWLIELVTALNDAKRLLFVAGGFDSTPLSDGASKKVAFQFQCVTCKLQKALGNLPYDHFDISEEVQEQVDLVRTQLRRATERYRPFKLKLLYHKEIDSNLLLVRNHMAGTRAYQVIDLEASCNSSRPGDDQFGSTVDDKGDHNNEIVDDIKKQYFVAIPDDYLCPISLELMRDPVIVATGQTYERIYIQQWIEGGNVTCPKSQLRLQNRTLTPNNVLRSLISQWCTNNNIEQPTIANGKLKKSDGSLRDVSDDIAAIEALVLKLSSRSVEERRTAVTETAVSAVLVKEIDGQQHPVYYVSKSLLDAETRYTLLEKYVLALTMAASKLRPYFESHPILVRTNLPIKSVLRKPDLSGRMAKWSVKLSTYDITYEPRSAIKSQALADFVADFSPALQKEAEQEVLQLAEGITREHWILYTDGAANVRGTGLGIMLKSPQGDIIAHAVSCDFTATNNESEYEALIAGLTVSLDMGIQHIEVKSDSLLMVNQINGTYAAKDSRMILYLEKVSQLMAKFKTFDIE